MAEEERGTGNGGWDGGGGGGGGGRETRSNVPECLI